MPNKSTLYQRIITHPGATLAPRQDDHDARPIAGFEVFYVYARPPGEPGMVQVGRAADGRIDGWIPAVKTIDWKHTLVGAFTNPAHRQRVLFLDSEDAERQLLLDPQGGETARHMHADATAGRPGHVIAEEPEYWANIDERFYLLPILSAAPVEREFGPPPRLLEVISAPLPKPPPSSTDFKAGLVFLVDTTMSMQPWIDGTRAVIRQIVARIRSTPMANLFRFGLVAYRDSLADTQALEYDAKVYAKPDFSQPADAILSAIDRVSESKVSSMGYDEDPIGGLKAALDQIAWDDISVGYRHIILITDAGARLGNHPHSMTHMGIQDIKAAAAAKGVWIWVLHLQTALGAQYNDLGPAAAQYRELTSRDVGVKLYYPVPDGAPGRYATQADFENQADHLARTIITLAAETSGRPSPDLGPAHGPPPRQLTDQLPIIREAIRLAYFGHEERTTAPEAVRSWTADHDLDDPNHASLEVRVLLTKNQLSDLASTLKGVLREGRAGQLEPQNFFTQLQATVASGFRDPQQIAHADRIAGFLGEFLDDLPYKSTLLETTATEWAQMTAIARDAIMNGIDERLSLYAFYDAQPDKWYDLGKSGNPGEAVYPVPLRALP